MTDAARQKADEYGIEPADIRETVKGSRDSDSRVRGPEPLTAPGGTDYNLHSRDYLAPDAPYFLVVLTTEREGETVALSSHVAPERLLHTREQGRPLAMLRRLANSPKFGLGISVWGHIGRFFSDEYVQPAMQAGSSEGVQLADDPPAGHSVVVEDWTRQPGDGEIQVLLAFAVDATAVREDLGLG